MVPRNLTGTFFWNTLTYNVTLLDFCQRYGVHYRLLSTCVGSFACPDIDTQVQGTMVFSNKYILISSHVSLWTIPYLKMKAMAVLLYDVYNESYGCASLRCTQWKLWLCFSTMYTMKAMAVLLYDVYNESYGCASLRCIQWKLWLCFSTM
jgi:hypothetical protein